MTISEATRWNISEGTRQTWADPRVRAMRAKRYRVLVNGVMFDSIDRAWEHLWPGTRSPRGTSGVIALRRRLRDAPTHTEVFRGYRFELRDANGDPLP